MANGYQSPWGNIRNESGLANLYWDFGLPGGSGLPANLSPEQLYGQNFNWLMDILKPMATGMNPAYEKAMAAGNRNINQQYRNSVRDVNTNLASSGFRGSGANLIGDLLSRATGAKADLAANIGLQNVQSQQAAANLIGQQNQLQAGANMANAQYQTGSFQDIMKMLLGQQANKWQAEAQQVDPWGQLAGSFASGIPMGLAFLAGSDEKIKENIKYTGEKTREGIPIAIFSYKDDPEHRRYRGVIAQDVEKIRPDAVIKAVDYSKL